MIDLKEELKNYSPIDMKILEDEGADLPDNIKNSIILYNKALESLQNGSEDIAVIELRKAIALNPDFYEAVNLLGVCYSYLNDQQKAIEMFERVVNAENNGVRALSYINQIKSGQDGDAATASSKKKGAVNKKKLGKSKEPKEIAQPSLKAEQYPGKQQNQNKNKIPLFNDSYKIKLMAVSFIAGLILPLLIVIPVIKGNSTKEIAKISGEKDELLSQIEELNDKYDQLSETNKNLEKDLQEANSNIDYYKFTLKLFEVKELADNKKYEDAADMLILLKTFDFQDEEKSKFEEMYKNIMPLAAESAYNKAYAKYINREYEEALKLFEKVRLYDEKYSRIDATLYYMGRSYKELNNSRNAIAMFQQILDNYPNSYYYSYAKYRINELTQMP
ncbi:MAG TPA: tetratricopeptide repeat protein [Clostridiaceae bacterium]|nr:tetratricopeptide repeat protein [Clostridiaceae bacterium]